MKRAQKPPEKSSLNKHVAKGFGDKAPREGLTRASAKRLDRGMTTPEIIGHAKLSQTTHRGTPCLVLDRKVPATGQRVRRYYGLHELDLARRDAALLVQADNAGRSLQDRTISTILTDVELRQAEAAFQRLASLGHRDLMAVVNAGLLVLPSGAPVPLAPLVDEYLQQVAGRISPRTLDEYRKFLGQLAQACPDTSAFVDRRVLSRWVLDAGAWHQRRQRRAAASAFWSWLAQPERTVVAGVNPFSTLPLGDRGTIRETHVLTPEAFARALASVVREKAYGMAGWLVLGGLCGLRPSEVERIEWRHVDFEMQKLELDASVVRKKGRSYRTVDLSPVAIEWLEWLRARKLKRPAEFVRRVFARAQEASRADTQNDPHFWQDILRHSYGTYLYRQTGDERRVSEQMGNSPQVVHRHYKSVKVSQADVARWFALTPGAVAAVVLDDGAGQAALNLAKHPDVRAGQRHDGGE